MPKSFEQVEADRAVSELRLALKQNDRGAPDEATVDVLRDYLPAIEDFMKTLKDGVP